jgi:hypothetical protein
MKSTDLARMDLISAGNFKIVSSLLLIYFVCVASNAFGAELFMSNDTPFNLTHDQWIGKWWNWWISTSIDQFDENGNPLGTCLMNSSEAMVMLMETTVNDKPHQVCKISSHQGIIIPLWTGFMEGSVPPYNGYSYDQLTKAAREELDLGSVTSLVKVDGIPIAKLDVVSSLRGSTGILDYKINSMQNVTEIYSKGFNITIPENTHVPEQNPGTWHSGAHGWFVFLKPLTTGNHEIFYNVAVSGTGPNDHSSEITYSLNVE